MVDIRSSREDRLRVGKEGHIDLGKARRNPRLIPRAMDLESWTDTILAPERTKAAYAITSMLL